MFLYKFVTVFIGDSSKVCISLREFILPNFFSRLTVLRLLTMHARFWFRYSICCLIWENHSLFPEIDYAVLPGTDSVMNFHVKLIRNP